MWDDNGKVNLYRAWPHMAQPVPPGANELDELSTHSDAVLASSLL